MKATKYLGGLLVMVSLSFNAFSGAVYVGDNGSNGCLTSDFVTSTDCVGLFDPGNDHGVNSIFTTTEFSDWETSIWGSSQTWNDIGGIGFGEGATSGNWNVGSWGDNATVLAVIKAGDHASAYLVDTNFLSGTWDISGANWTVSVGKGGQTKNNGISHIGFWGNGTTTVPEPLSGGLMLLGVIGLALSRKVAR